MKKRFLALVISVALLLPQGSIMSIAAKAADVNVAKTSINAVNIEADIVVDGSLTGESGQVLNGIKTVKTVKEALDAVPADNTNEYVIYVKDGIYKEKLKISKPNITIVGQSAKGTKITFDDAAGTPKRAEDGGAGTYGTSGSSSVTIQATATGFSAANVTFENSFDESNTEYKNVQAVAVKNEADQSAFYNCRFIGNQDTLYPNKNKQLYKNCYIEGDVDFIFGGGQAVFENCEIFSVNRPGAEAAGFVTAPSTLGSNEYGFLIENSNLTSNAQAGSIYLGRPWHPSSATEAVNSNVVYKNCNLGSHIAKDGWTTMSSKGVLMYPKDNNMLEFGSTGEGAVTDSTENRRLLSETEAAKYTPEKVLAGWDYNTKANELAAYEENATVINKNGNSSETNSNNEFEKVIWKQTRFGITTSEEQNKISVDNENKTITLSAGKKDGSATGGKVTGSNDGISYYYTELDKDKNFELTADVKVNYFEKVKPDKQAGFGIMARDTLGVENDVSIAPSNEVIVGGYKGLVQSVYRDGVTPNLDSKITMNGIHKFRDRPDNDGTATYKLTLKKTNTGYIASVDGGEEVTYYTPDLLESVENDKYYLGFFVARVAGITVSNVNLKTSNAADDPAGEKAPEVKVKPSVKITSTDTTGSEDYTLKVEGNTKGNVTVSQDGKEMYSKAISDKSTLMIPTVLKGGDNVFDVTFTAEDGTVVTNSKTVTCKSYGAEQGDVYVSQTGSEDGKGTVDSPVDIYTALKYTGNGQTIKVKGGTYNLNKPIEIKQGNDGTIDKVKTLTTYDGERAIFDFGKVSAGFTLGGDYWKIKGVDFCNTSDTEHGMTVSGNNNIVEDVKTYNNGDTGLQISGDTADDFDKWPSNNLILNCESYNNMDAAMNNADGFAAKISVGNGNVFKGCIAHHNCDDGWDLFSKLESGAIGAVTIEDCIAYKNGNVITNDGTETKEILTDGDGNGFKLGGEGIPVKHTLINSLSFGNNKSGITGNSNPACVVKGSISVDNEKNYSLDYYTNVQLKYEFDNNISFMTKGGDNDFIPDMVKSETNYFYDGTETANINGEKLTADDFKSTKMPEGFARDENGNIIRGDYMVLKEKSSITPEQPGNVDDNNNSANENNGTTEEKNNGSSNADSSAASGTTKKKAHSVKTGDMGSLAAAAFAGLGFIGAVKSRKKRD